MEERGYGCPPLWTCVIIRVIEKLGHRRLLPVEIELFLILVEVEGCHSCVLVEGVGRRRRICASGTVMLLLPSPDDGGMHNGLVAWLKQSIGLRKRG